MGAVTASSASAARAAMDLRRAAERGVTKGLRCAGGSSDTSSAVSSASGSTGSAGATGVAGRDTRTGVLVGDVKRE